MGGERIMWKALLLGVLLWLMMCHFRKSAVFIVIVG